MPAVLFVVILFSAFVAHADDELRYLQSLAGADYHAVESQHTERRYHVFVDAPAATGDERYPVIYLLDGGVLFPMLSTYHRYLRLGGEVPPAIIVGISYGSDDFENGNFRSTDFTAPSAERSFWGGAARFQAFLADELLPLIEARYPADPGERMIFGHSLGGQFVLFNAQTRPGLFQAHIASNPAIHRNLEFFLETRPADAERAATRLFVGVGENDALQFAAPRAAWLRHWSGQADAHWRLVTREYAGHSHMSTPPLVWRDALLALAAPSP